MIKRLTTQLTIGGLVNCRQGDESWSVVHACKSPCHQLAVGYTGSLPKTHPSYLTLAEPYDLYMNLIDPPVPLFMKESFVRFLNFADSALKTERNLLIHCNLGESRAPSLAMLLLAKRLAALEDNYQSASEGMKRLYPGFNPGKGIQIYLSEHWDEIR
jgi:hypothetical protein